MVAAFVFSYLFPARGRKRQAMTSLCDGNLGLFLSFPRKGTETFRADFERLPAKARVFSYLFPARGRKLEIVLQLFLAPFYVFSYLFPARGRKHH
ncbi:MAG: hypothetical protein HLUCCO16_14495 [Phormidium sp. OSCR]|nr:MAG: hypothetical protein HLUCCO16_14495 [Phormidium sp. OSCR]